MPDTSPISDAIRSGAGYPAQVTVFCDGCGVEHDGDYLVRETDDQATRFGYARTHLRVNQGWICDDRGDYCPACVPAVAANPAHPTLVTNVQPVGFTDRAMFTDTETAVLKLHGAKRLGYLAAQDEWTNGDEPLGDAMQQAANRLYHAGWLPEFAAEVSG